MASHVPPAKPRLGATALVSHVAYIPPGACYVPLANLLSAPVASAGLATLPLDPSIFAQITSSREHYLV